MSIVRELVKRDLEVIRVPANASVESIEALSPHAVFISNGPGNPDMTTYAIESAKSFVKKIPVGGICLGNGIIAAAFGGHNYKLKYGHRGGNQPVKDLKTGKVFMTSQNHGFNVHPGSIEGTGLVISEINANDGTVEAIEHESLPIFSTQYHPEANPGPYDSTAAKFDRFKEMIEGFYEA
jgi:carbamoyl-phosphate synthase small subunit